MPGLAMGAQDHAHLLQHVTIVVDAGFVETDRHIDPLRLEAVERRDPTAQAKIRAAIATDIGSRLGQFVESCSESQTPCPKHLGPSRPKRSI